jgi:hypothetical protein
MQKASCCYENPVDINNCVDCADYRGCINGLVRTWQKRANDQGIAVCGSYKACMDRLQNDPVDKRTNGKISSLVSMLNEHPAIHGCMKVLAENAIPKALNPDPNKNLLAPYMNLHAIWPEERASLPTLQSPMVPDAIKDPGTYPWPFSTAMEKETYMTMGSRCMRAFIFYALFAYVVYKVFYP